MTVQELKDYPYLKMEIQRYTEQLEYWKSKPITIPDKRTRGEYISAVNELIEFYAEILQKRKNELERIKSFLANITDPLYADIFHLRFERGFNWLQVWDIMTDKGYYYGPDSYRTMARRYLEKASL